MLRVYTQVGEGLVPSFPQKPSWPEKLGALRFCSFPDSSFHARTVIPVTSLVSSRLFPVKSASCNPR